MVIPPEVWRLVLGFGVVHGALLACIFLMVKRGRVAANRWLAGVLLVNAVLLGQEVLKLTGGIAAWPHLLLVSFPLWFLMGPLAYAYFRTMLGYRITPSWGTMAHLLPFALVVAVHLPFYLQPAQAKLEDLRTTTGGEMAVTLGLLVLYTGVMLGYLYAAYREVQRSERATSREAAHLPLRWLKRLLIAFLVFVAVDSVVFFTMYATGYYLPDAAMFSITLLTVLTSLIAYESIAHPNAVFPVPEAKPKYARTRIAEAERRALEIRLGGLMESEKPYLNPSLKQTDLAEALGVSSHILSQILTQGLQTSFSDYVNRYRVEEAKRRLQDLSRNETVMGVALDAGFNSSASFYRAFKKHSGLTPTAYLKRTQHPADVGV